MDINLLGLLVFIIIGVGFLRNFLVDTKKIVIPKLTDSAKKRLALSKMFLMKEGIVGNHKLIESTQNLTDMGETISKLLK